MEILWGTEARPSDDRPTVATVGMFDGVHRGHKMLFDRVLATSKALDARAGVVTFDPHPLEVLAPDKAPCMLTTIEQRLGLFEESRFDVALVLPFNRELAALTPHEFARAALVEELHVCKILVGEDFRFGHNRAGDVSTLREIGTTDGFEAEAIGLLEGDEGQISSSDIRLLLSSGRVEGATVLSATRTGWPGRSSKGTSAAATSGSRPRTSGHTRRPAFPASVSTPGGGYGRASGFRLPSTWAFVRPSRSRTTAPDRGLRPGLRGRPLRRLGGGRVHGVPPPRGEVRLGGRLIDADARRDVEQTRALLSGYTVENP